MLYPKESAFLYLAQRLQGKPLSLVWSKKISANSAEEAEFLCDRIAILVNGSLKYIGKPKEVVNLVFSTFSFSCTVLDNS